MAENRSTLKPEQFEAINRDGANILVSASAGSGKTFVMIKRLIRLITEGKAKVDEVLAATFTEAAAADMKEKLKKALIEEVEKGNRKIAAELNKVATADICTLHSFCARLIRTYFFAAGVAPDFKVADESETSAMKKESMEETFRALYSDKDAKFLKLAERYRTRRKDDTFKKVVYEIYDYAITEKDPEKLINSYAVNYTAAGADRFLRVFEGKLKKTAEIILAEVSALKAECEKAGYSAGASQCSEFSEIVFKILSGGAATAREYAVPNALPRITGKNPEQGAEYLKDRLKNYKSHIKALCDFALKTDIDRGALSGLYENGKILAGVVSRFTEVYGRKKRENNVLDFADLERFALIALKDESVKAAVRKKYKYVFVDEYQDVNAVQEEIISAVTDGNLFMVGDAKQSIYGFRGCRAEIFEQKEKTVKDCGGAAIRLNYNFRSADRVIDMVNAVFDFCYIKEYTGVDYKSTARLQGGGIYPENAAGRAELHYLFKDKAQKAERPAPRIYNILDEAFKKEEKETASVSNLLAKIIDGELTKNYYDIKTEKFKRVTMSDIAVLTRAGDTAYVRNIVQGLNAHGIRVVSSVSQNVCDFPEIKTLINVLKLVDCFIWDAPLVGTLLSVVGNFTEEDLVEVATYYADNADKKTKNKSGFSAAFSYYLEHADGELCGRLKKFKEYFDALRYLADFKGAKGVLDKVIEDSGYENFLLASADGEEQARRLYRFLAETESGDRLRTVSEFLSRVENSPDAFEISGGGEDDAVKVMTIHSSKGLEFPVVIVCGLEKSFNRQDEYKPVFCDRDEGFFALSFDDAKRTVSTTGYREILKAKMRETTIKEEMRLFYVALTRAAYSLHLVFEKNADTRAAEFSKLFTESACFLDFVPAEIPVTTHLPTELSLADVRRKARQVLVAKPDIMRAEKMKKDFAFLYPYLSATTLPLKNSVTAAIKNKEEVYPVNTLFIENGDTDREKGVIAHRIMEHYDFNGEFYTQLSAMEQAGVISPEEISKIDTERLKRVVESGVFDSVKNKTLYREQDFIVNIAAAKVFDTDSDEEVLLQGVIDLLAVSGNTAEIVDYKYSSLGKEGLKRKYGEQLNLYAYAAERALGVKVLSKTLVNIFTGETVRVE